MENRYRVKCISTHCFEPQIKRWWWPFWKPVSYSSSTGYDYGPMTVGTEKQAWDAIDSHKRASYKPVPTYQYEKNGSWSL